MNLVRSIYRRSLSAYRRGVRRWQRSGVPTEATDLLWRSIARLERHGPPVPIRDISARPRTTVDSYWHRHTVNNSPFKTALQSRLYLRWRFAQYPLFQELMQLYEPHHNEVVLDYGCGPANDLVGFATLTKARKVIGVDVSGTALSLASHHLSLYNVPLDRVELIKTSDANPVIPLDDESVDYIYSEGVLQHSSDPASILKEFFRILRRGSGRVNIMVYNKDSLWLHLYTAYVKLVLENAFPGLDAHSAFERNTDGVGCPIARCYACEEFIALCRQAGFAASYAGGYFSLTEIEALRLHGTAALDDERLGTEHRHFLAELVTDERGYSTFKGKFAGIGGVYRLSKP